jgi:heme exporter protein A
MTEPYLTVKELAHAYGSNVLFSNISFSLTAGLILQVTGRNGSGKTTLLQLLSGLKTPQEGIISCEADVAYIGHRNAIKGELSPLENLSLYQPNTAACAKALEEMGLEKSHHNRPCYRLSAGQQRKVALSRVILSDAKVWLLDEPFTALDEAAKACVVHHLEIHAQAGGSAVVATHERLDVNKSILREMALS